MPKVLIAKNAGFCYGVKRAITLAERAAKEHYRVYTLGPLIHNPQEVKRLSDMGIKTATDTNIDKDATVIVRSHGISPEKERFLKDTFAKVIDATCPYVKAVHEAVVSLAKEGYFVVIVGEKDHPEVHGTIGYLEEAKGRYKVVDSFEDVEDIEEDRVGVVAQTTQNEIFFENVVLKLLKKVKELKVINTICNATEERQSDIYELAPIVDVMIIIGGKNSGNTKRLFEISKSLNERSYHIETKDEIDPSWLEGAETIGISAGASTPDWIIEDVRYFLENHENFTEKL
ncbi:MAG: 4-hydroxy-3-methylbut-2-enyl diphosphate reductase [Hydrogenobaculum sp.]